MGSNQQFSLRWNNYLSHITEAFDTLRSDEDLVDVTLSCEGKRIRAHKMLLSACSTYFRDLFKENPCQHPVIIFRNVKFDDLVALIDFIYQGEVNVVQEQLSSFLTTAELLAVQGLSEGSGKDTNSDDTELDQPDSTTLPSEPEVKLFNRGPYTFQQLPGTSNGPGASVSLHPVEKQTESTPIIKRRKLSSNISISQPYPHNRKNEETERRVDQETSETNGISNDSVTGISAVPNLKMEIPEYTERNEDASACSFSDSNRERTNGVKLQSSDRDSTSNLTQTLSTVSRETKQEPPDMYHSNLTVPPVLPPAESLIAPNLCHMLAKPGPSTENQLQDTFKSDRGIHGNDSWFSFLSNSDYLSLTDRKPDFRDRHYVCKICGKTFRNQNSCYNHMAIHKGTSKCTICECVLSSRGNMKRHMHNVHGVDYSV